MGLEKKDDKDSPEDGKDLMQSTLIALGWEEGADGEGTQKVPNKDEVIKQLKQENQALARQLEEKTSAIKDGEGKISTLMSELERSKEKIAQLEKVNVQPSPPAAPVTSQAEDGKDLAEKIAVQSEVIATLQAKLKELSITREAASDGVKSGIEAKLAGTEAELEAALARLKDATSKIDEQAAMLSSREATIEEQGQKINDLDESVKDLKKQVVDIIGENTGLGGEIQAKLEQLSTRESRINQMEARIRQQEDEIVKARLSIDTLKSENEELHYHLKESDGIIDRQKKELLQCESDTSEGLGKLQQIIDDLKEELTVLKRDKQAAAGRADALARQVEEGEKKRIGVEAVLDKTSKDLAFYQERYFEQKARIKALDAQVEELQKANDQKSALIKDLETASATFDAAKKALDAESAKIAADFEKQKAALEARAKACDEGGQYKAKAEQAEARIGQLEASLSTAQVASQNAEKAAKEAKARHETLQADLKKVGDDKARLEEQLKVSKAKIDQLEKELEGSSDDEELMDTVMKTEAENTKLKEELSTREKEIDKYKRRINELQEASKDKEKSDEEIRNLKISNKELRRRLEKYEKP